MPILAAAVLRPTCPQELFHLNSHAPQSVISSTTRQAICGALTHADLVPHNVGLGSHHPSYISWTHWWKTGMEVDSYY